MNSDQTPSFVHSLLTLFEEAYVGPPDSKSTWFTDNAPQHALLDTLAGVDAEQASVVAPSGYSIAAHAEHLRWSLVLAQVYLRGERPHPDWEESWRVSQVNEEQWATLRGDLQRDYEKVRDAIPAVSDWSDSFFLTGTLVLLPHAAYHLGAIRQMAHLVSQDSI